MLWTYLKGERSARPDNSAAGPNGPAHEQITNGTEI